MSDDWNTLSPAANHDASPAVDTVKADPLAAIQTLDGNTRGQMLAYYDNPSTRPKGETTHIPELDPLFKWMPGYTNLLTAWPGHGKSEIKRQLLLLRAIYAQKKSLYFAPEDMPKEAWYDALIHSLTGFNPDPECGRPLPRAYYERAMEFVREYFYVVVCPKGMGKTPGHILDIFEAGRAKRGIEHFVLDPWNKADHSGLQAAGGFQPYLVKELGAFTDWCTTQQTYLSLIAHPKGQLRPRGEARAVPDSDGVSGGQTWDDMMMTICALFRPNMHVQRNDPAVAFYTHKLKNHRRIGAKPGSIGEGSEDPSTLIEFDWKTARYTFNGVTPLASPAVSSIYAPELSAPPVRSPLPPERPGTAWPPSDFDRPTPTAGIRIGLPHIPE